MSLQYDNDSPMTELDRLMQQNAEAVETIQLTPYQPIVWAIPDDIRQQEQALLEQAVERNLTDGTRPQAFATRQEVAVMLLAALAES